MASFFLLPKSRLVLKAIYAMAAWITVSYLIFYFSYIQRELLPITSHVNRDLLQHATQAGSDIVQSSDILDMEPLVDKRPSETAKILQTLLSNHSNVPLAYWTNAKPRGDKKSNNCSAYPGLYDLDFNNIYWQRLITTNGTFYLYGAYFDNRMGIRPTPLVRILAMVDRIYPLPTVCQFWFEGDKDGVSAFSPASYTYIWHKQWGNYKDGLLQPYIISCQVPEKEAKSRIPASVSLVQQQCFAPTNNLKVINNRPQKKQDFAVCVKGLDFLQEDLSVRLVEWIELLFLLGAKKIFMYEFDVHPNITKVLRYYEKKGWVKVTPITLPGNQPNLPVLRHLYFSSKVVNKRQNELIPYNDCLYQNLYAYDYLVLLDTDEVIVPTKPTGWKELVEEVVQLVKREHKKPAPSSYNARNVYFLDDMDHGKEMEHVAHENGIPRYLHMLQHVLRSKNFTKPGEYVKSFHLTDRVVALHNHFPIKCMDTCTSYPIDTELAHMHHYRKSCVGTLKKSCQTDFQVHTVRDTTIWRYKNTLIERTTYALGQLGFFGQPQGLT